MSLIVSRMTADFPHLPYLALYIVSAGLLSSDSRGATHWKLNEFEGVVRATDTNDILKSDPVLSILTKGNPPKVATNKKTSCDHCAKSRSHGASPVVSAAGPTALELFQTPSLTCGSPANETVYDHLEGIAQRHLHRPYAEPEVAMIFKKNEMEDIDLNEIENHLLRGIQESPTSVVLCNQIGNFWRIRGSTYHSIECFRKALAQSPNNADVLLNLARVLFNLNFLEDAIYLTQQSLEMQPSDHNCWLQHFTLGEILKASGKTEQAGIHFQQALELNPSFHPAEVHLREIGLPSTSPTNTYTFLIIGFLVVVVLAVVYFMTLASENRASKCSKVPVWVDGKRPKKRLST